MANDTSKLPQIYVGGDKKDELKPKAPPPKPKQYEDWYEMGKDKAFGSKPVLRST